MRHTTRLEHKAMRPESSGDALRTCLKRYSAFLILFLWGCPKYQKPAGSYAAQWVLEEPGIYRFDDPNLEVTFTHTTERTGTGLFRWHFENRHALPLTIEHGGLFLERRGDPATYSLWGEPKKGNPSQPPIVVQPGTFVTLVFPVRYRSIFQPFRVIEDGSVLLHMDVRWGEEAWRYRLVFPADSR